MNIKYNLNGKIEVKIGEITKCDWPIFEVNLINGYAISVNADNSNFIIKETTIGEIAKVYNIKDTIEILREVSGLKEVALAAVEAALRKEYNYLTNNGRCIVIF